METTGYEIKPRVLIFPLEYIPNDELYDVDEYLNSRNLDIYHAFNDLDYESTLFLSLFLRLIETEKQKFLQLENFCEDEDFHGSLYKPPCELSEEILQQNCKQFMKRKSEYSDVIERDKNYTKYMKGRSINVVMLLYNGVYHAHVYSWEIVFDPLDFIFDFKPDLRRKRFRYIQEYQGKKVTMMLGIRSRIESIFLASCGIQKVKGVAKLLLEGVRRHTVEVGSFLIIVPDPIGPMPDILKSIGFIKAFMSREYTSDLNEFVITLGFLNSFKKYWGICDKCYYSTNILNLIPGTGDLIVIDYY